MLMLFICFDAKGQGDGAYYRPTGTGVYSFTASSSTIAGLPDWYQNLQKYWFYRYRLVNDFTYVGPNPGESLIAYERNKGDGAHDAIPFPNTLDFEGDQTIDLGSYLAVLATEYEQLKQNGFSTARTIMELQYAQNAYDRLRSNSDYYYDMGWDANRYPPATMPLLQSPTDPSDVFNEWKQGFFVRDDVPYLDFIDSPADYSINLLHYHHFNRPALLNVEPAGTYT